jgi:5-oxoprolinase (ATP-hydrolysing) subunit B
MTDAQQLSVSAVSLSLTPMGESAWLCELPETGLDIALQQRIMSLSERLVAYQAVRETVPGMNNLLVIFDPFHPQAADLELAICNEWAYSLPTDQTGEILDIPVSYGGDDLVECATRSGMSPDAFAHLHAAGEYTVYALGSHPGFAYLGGLDERLCIPRRAVPRPKVTAGTVMIGGSQTGVQACDNPTGWNLIGKTDTRFFDPAAMPPTLLRPGMRVRFVFKEIVL